MHSLVIDDKYVHCRCEEYFILMAMVADFD